MAGWFIPVLKSLLPHVGTIVSAAAPVFTKKNSDPANQAALLQQQITELQAAASENDAHIKSLATHIQSAVEALEKGTSLAEKNYRRALTFSILSFIFSAAALCLVLYMLFA